MSSPGEMNPDEPSAGSARRRGGIRGPQSALTDFLASHNISAAQIQQDHQRRREAANAEAGPSNQAPTPPSEVDDGLGRPQPKNSKRKRDEKATIAKIKASKKFQRQRKQIGSDSEGEAELVMRFLRQANTKVPGQMDNCESCGTRFTVTNYTRAGPTGGLLCTPCGKNFEKEAGKDKKKRVSKGPAANRRKLQSGLLDGTYHLGAKSLLALCIETLVKNIDLADDLGDLPDSMIDKIARILSKKRLIDSNTLHLFLQPTNHDVCVYDAAKLTSDDLKRIMQMTPDLKKLKIRCGIQFKDEVMEYLISRDIKLESLSLHGANLLSDKMWATFLAAKGDNLRTLRVYYTDNHFGDDILALLPTKAPNLRQLKVAFNQKVTAAGIKHLSKIKNLEHLALQLHHEVHPDVFVELLQTMVSQLKTLSLRAMSNLDNSLLDALNKHCRSLRKLRITDSEVMTDAGFTRLFSNWQNPGLEIIDFSKCRQMDSANPRKNPNDVGLCSHGFKALMAHSGATLRDLNIMSCRHISAEAFEEVFSPTARYNELRSLEISFCESVTDFIVASIFRSCPKLSKLVVFGCMKVKDVRVPKGKILIGVPNAVGMQIEGHD